MAAVNSASGAPAASEYTRTSSAMKSSQALTLPPLLSCHWPYALLSFATLSEGDPIGVTSWSGRDEMGARAPRAGAIVSHRPSLGHGCPGHASRAFRERLDYTWILKQPILRRPDRAVTINAVTEVLLCHSEAMTG